MRKKRARNLKRDAQRWHDEFVVRALPFRSMKELRAKRETAKADLERRDKALFEAVEKYLFDRMINSIGLTLEQWRAAALQRERRRAKIRVALGMPAYPWRKSAG